MLSLPDEADSLAFLGERLGRGRRKVLLGDDELGPRVQRDDVAGVGPEIDDGADAPERRPVVVSRRPPPASARRIFSGRMVNVPRRPRIGLGDVAGQQVGRARRSPATKRVAGRS